MDAKIKDLLIQLQPLPKYQFERRIDIFILSEIEEVFSKIYGEKIYFLYPEFPLSNLKLPKGKPIVKMSLDEIHNLEKTDTNQNTNVDYLLASANTFYFVELKTDLHSVDKDSQLIYYAHYSNKNFSELYNFFKYNLANGKNQNKKWKTGLEYLLDKYLHSFNQHLEHSLNKEIKIVYLGPDKIESKLQNVNQILGKDIFTSVTFKQFNKHVSDIDLQEILTIISK
jgi:hypothetical protein